MRGPVAMVLLGRDVLFDDPAMAGGAVAAVRDVSGAVPATSNPAKRA